VRTATADGRKPALWQVGGGGGIRPEKHYFISMS